MTSTIEISLYPLTREYTTSVLAFLRELKEIPSIELHTNGMSTIIIGHYEQIWRYLIPKMESQLKKEDCVIVMKVAGGRREYVE